MAWQSTRPFTFRLLRVAMSASSDLPNAGTLLLLPRIFHLSHTLEDPSFQAGLKDINVGGRQHLPQVDRT